MSEEIEINLGELLYDEYGSGNVFIPCPSDFCNHSDVHLSNMTFHELVNEGEITCNSCGKVYTTGKLSLKNEQ